MVAVTELIDRKSEMIYGFLRREVVDGCLFDVHAESEEEELADEEDVEGTPHHNVAPSNWVVTQHGGSNSKKHRDKHKEKRKEKHKQKHKEELRKRTPCTYARLHAFATRTVLDVAVLQDDFDWSDFERRVCTHPADYVF
ncbi:hypothetical protein BDN72DRAFT_638136 [Pluteus cervinus]|uniref:Uncharacterized protein n=1 Tax=Pluteus cervinus TaxID=181527 RepID=A0ACD3ATK4_9AGAR|nr:hypothetical protein BDN72DRAFT_638136 [Pluteus cervinus]